jgi:hypothetical protein
MRGLARWPVGTLARWPVNPEPLVGGLAEELQRDGSYRLWTCSHPPLPMGRIFMSGLLHPEMSPFWVFSAEGQGREDGQGPTTARGRVRMIA